MIEERLKINMNNNTIKNITVYDKHEDVPPDYRALKIFAIFLAIFVAIGIFFVVLVISYGNITGNILTSKYVSDYCRKDLCVNQMIANFFSAFVIWIAVIYEWASQTCDKRPNNMPILWKVVLVLIICLGFSCLDTYKTFKVFSSEPVISTAQISDKYTKASPSRRGSKRYYFKFSDGSKYKTTSEEYEEANIGDTYYIAYFGGTAVQIFDADEYSLPE